MENNHWEGLFRKILKFGCIHFIEEGRDDMPCPGTRLLQEMYHLTKLPYGPESIPPVPTSSSRCLSAAAFL